MYLTTCEMKCLYTGMLEVLGRQLRAVGVPVNASQLDEVTRNLSQAVPEIIYQAQEQARTRPHHLQADLQAIQDLHDAEQDQIARDHQDRVADSLAYATTASAAASERHAARLRALKAERRPQADTGVYARVQAERDLAAAIESQLQTVQP